MTFPRAFGRLHKEYINKVMLRLAGHGALADLEHVGRRSGLVRHTPVRAFHAGDTVVIGLNFGRGSDWLRNIQASHGCRMRLGDELLELGDPRIVPVTEGVRGMPRAVGFALRYVVRTTDCVELPVLSSAPAGEPTRRRQ